METKRNLANHGKKRNVEIDTIRGMAIILMVLGHSFLIYPIDFFHKPGYYEFHRWFYTFHMGALFFVAGAVYRCKDYLPFVWKKVRRILGLYAAYYLKEMATSEHPFLQKTQYILGECSKYSLQIYLFDAFWMVAIRTVLINFLHITLPIVILFFMTTVNISCTLIACKYVLPKSKLLSWATGL